MIQVSRSIIRQFRAVFKKSVSLHCQKSSHPPIVMKADAHGLTIHAQHDGLALSVHVDGLLSAEQIIVPARALEDFEGRDQTNVELQYTTSTKILARWTDRGVPREAEYELSNADKPSNLPTLADAFTEKDVGLVKALDDAMNTVASNAVRYATNKIQLRGQNGEIVATDGRQLLWQSGFQFPWSGELLVPRVKAFSCSELANEKFVAIGKTAAHVCVRVGAWTLFLPIDKEGRFPQIETVIPNRNSTTTHLHLDDKDVTFLAKTLPRLPGDEDTDSPITLDLNGHVAVRARAQEQERATEAVLSRSQATGQTIRFATNRKFFSKALDLGFTEIHFVDADHPVLCNDERRKFVFVGLDKKAALAPTNNDLRLASDVETSSIPQPPVERIQPTMKRTPPLAEPATIPTNGQHTNGQSTNGQTTNGETKSENGQHKAGNFAELLEEAQAIQNLLRDLLLRTNQFITGFKQHHRQTKAMRSTLASLRQLQQIEV